MSSAPNAGFGQVYVGSWINWSQGQVTGATLTLSSNNGSLLIAFLALFVAWSGSQLWTLICYILHQRRSTSDPQDALHHQQQVLLRLGLSNIEFLWRLLKTTRAWKKHEPLRLVRRQWPLISFGVIHCAVIFIASIFISQLADAKGEVLLRSSECGFVDMKVLQRAQENLTALPGVDAFYVTAKWFYGMAKEYSRKCYTQTALLGSPGCNEFIRPTIDSSVRFSEPCPFQDVMCETPAITIDTGFIDSHQHLGVNTPPADRVQLRKTLSCAVIPADRDHSSEWTTNATIPMMPWDPIGSGNGIGWKYYNLGPQTIMGLVRPSTFWVTNVTNTNEKKYGTTVFPAFIDDPLVDGFRPIPALNRTDADVTLLVLRNRAMYTNPVNDPFFKSTKHRADYSASFFTSDLNIGMLGCTEQYQFCNGEQKCSELHAWGPSSRKQVADSLGYNVAQRALFDLMSRAAYHTKIFNVGFMLEDAALLAKDLIYGEYGLSTGLPDDQWQREVRNLHNISIAAIQHSVVVHASTPNLDIGSGANSSHTYDWIVQESSSAQQKICQNQKISAPNFYSFNILSLSLLLVAGLVIIATSSMASSITKYWRRREQGKSQPRVSKSTSSTSADISFYCTKEWEYSDPLQLQRIALEGHGIAPWTETDSIPLPFDRQKLFRIPWLAGWPGKTFFIDRISLVV